MREAGLDARQVTGKARSRRVSWRVSRGVTRGRPADKICHDRLRRTGPVALRSPATYVVFSRTWEGCEREAGLLAPTLPSWVERRIRSMASTRVTERNSDKPGF